MNTRRRRLCTAAILAAGALTLLAGCGDSGPTPAEFARQVNTACRQASETPEASQAEQPSAATRLRGLSARLDEIEAPEELQGEYERFTTAMGRVAAYARLAEAGGDSDADPAELRAALTSMSAAARTLRIRECS